MATILKWGLILGLTFATFIFHSIHPNFYEKTGTHPDPEVETEDKPAAPSDDSLPKIFATIRPETASDISMNQLSTWERIVVTIRQISDSCIKYIGNRLESGENFLSPNTRGHFIIIIPFGIIAAIGLFLGHRRNVDSPHGPSFSLSLSAGKCGLIAAMFFTSSLLRELSFTYLGEAAVLAIVGISTTFSVVAGYTAFSKVN